MKLMLVLSERGNGSKEFGRLKMKIQSFFGLFSALAVAKYISFITANYSEGAQ